MFENILSFWRGRGFLEQSVSDFSHMLENAQKMFQLVCRKLIYNENVENLSETIRILDKEINELEKKIRKRIVEHLVLQPSVDVSACLVLMSVVKDAERLGDYCKNLCEIIAFLNKPLDQKKYKELFGMVDVELAEFFKETKKAFVESDQNIAKLTWDHKARISKRCEDVIQYLVNSDLPAKEAVCLTLIARHFKRLSSHLVNIATSVILPVDELDYFDETKKDGGPKKP